MPFKKTKTLFIAGLLLLLNACGDADKEENLVNLFTAANQDIISISFPAESTESIISINSEFHFTLQGLQSNNVDNIIINQDVIWSLSDNALSTIDQQGHLLASSTAELITLTAKFGHLTQTLELKISDAKFDEVVELNKQSFNINMCQSQNLTPIARYIDKNGIHEIRPVDSTIINTITWIIRNQEDNSSSQRAHIKTTDNQASLLTLDAGDIIIQAKALSVYSGTEITSVDFNQSVNNNLNSIKVCNSNDVDLITCNTSSANVEKDQVISLITVANYQALDGSNLYQNISQNSKWGINISNNASISFANDLQSLQITGKTESSIATLSTACGAITQSLTGIDISKGVTLNSLVSCDGNLNCLDSSVSIIIDKLGVLSLSVSTDNIDLTDNESTTLSSRPAEITLKVIANYTNNTNAIITGDDELVHSITLGDGTVIEDKENSPRVFTVLGKGSAKIKLDYRNETFVVSLVIP